MIIRQVIRDIEARLSSIGSLDARIEAEVLMMKSLQMDRAELYRDLEESVDNDSLIRVRLLTERRESGEPLAYIVGVREFYGLNICVNEGVLIPRPETETLVDEVVRLSGFFPDTGMQILDVGTGSGAIAIAVALKLPFSTVTAIEISSEAVKIAKENVEKHGVHDRVSIIQGDLLEPLKGQFDIIVSNPPYIPRPELASLQKEILKEPLIALDGGLDGLNIIRALFQQSVGKVKKRGAILLEIDPSQAQGAEEIAKQFLPYSSVKIIPDLMGNNRAICVWLN